MASQAHGEPNRANTPTDSQKKKKIKNQTYPPYPWSRRWQRKQRKPNPNTLIQSIQSKSKTNQNQYCVYQKKKPNTEPLYQNGKTKPKKPQIPNTRLSLPYLFLVIVSVGCSLPLSSQIVVVARPSS